MVKRKREDLTKKEFIVTLDTLYTAANAVRGRESVKLFLRDLLTPSERIMLGRRVIIARLLLAGESYDEISRRLKVGQTTISRVQRWLEDQFPGYEQAIREMEKEFDRRAQKQVARQPLSYAWLKRKYPIHFLFFPKPKIKHHYGEYPSK